MNGVYVTAKELSQVTKMSYAECLKVIDNCRATMQEKNLYVPKGKERLALTAIVKKYLGL